MLSTRVKTQKGVIINISQTELSQCFGALSVFCRHIILRTIRTVSTFKRIKDCSRTIRTKIRTDSYGFVRLRTIIRIRTAARTNRTECTAECSPAGCLSAGDAGCWCRAECTSRGYGCRALYCTVVCRESDTTP